MEEPTTKPSGSKPASPSRTYSDTDRSEVNTPAGLAPAVCASRPSAAGGSHVAVLGFCWFPNSGMVRLPLSLLTVRRGYYRPARPASPAGGAELVEPRGGAAQDGLAPGRGKLVDEPAQF